MRIIHTIATAMSIAMLAFTFLSCEDEKNQEIKSVQMPDGRIWMAKNLDIAIGKSECYDKDPANCQKCGRLYDWETAMKACPKGWHLPTDTELSDLAGAIGGDEAGKALKSKESWDGSDAYGFSLLPCGRGLDGTYDRMGNMGALWSATKINAEKSWVYGMLNADNKAYKDSVTKARLYSIRCIKDETKSVATEQVQQKEPEQKKEPEKQKTRSVYVLSKDLLLKEPQLFFGFLLGKDPCKDISNPVKQQDCVNNLNLNDILNKIESEEIGKIKTFTEIGNLSPKPESKMLCNIMANFAIAIDIIDKEKVEKFRKEINETNAARRKNGQGELIGSEITECLTLFENKYITEFYDNSNNTDYSIRTNYAIFANKEEAMNYEPKEGTEYKLKLKNIVFFYYIKAVGTPDEGFRKIKIYDYVGQNLSASK